MKSTDGARQGRSKQTFASAEGGAAGGATGFRVAEGFAFARRGPFATFFWRPGDRGDTTSEVQNAFEAVFFRRDF